MNNLSFFEKQSFARCTALISFLIGTLFFLGIILFSKNDNLIYFTIIYLFIALIINGIVVLWLLIKLVFDYTERDKTAIDIALLLSNIPIVILYTYIIFFSTIKRF